MTGIAEPAPKRTRLSLGLLKLTDAAPVIIAKELGFFVEEGLEVSLTIEPSWANVADKLCYGLIDGAVSLSPLVFAIALGLRGVGTPLIVPLTLSRNGNTVTLAKRITDLPPDFCAARSAAAIRDLSQAIGRKLKFGIVHAYSSHNFLLRYWLAAAGLDPERDFELTVLPPAQMVEAIAAERIDGFCAGAPWGAVAERDGLGVTLINSHRIWNNHPEKVLALRKGWAEGNPAALRGLLRALLRAAEFCDQPRNAGAIALILAQNSYFGLDAKTIATSLPAFAEPAEAESGETPSPLPERSVFFRGAANCPWYSDGIWILREMRRWAYLDPREWSESARLSQCVAGIYRPELYAEAAASLGQPAPQRFWKSEGRHEAPWLLEGKGAMIEMLPDRFCDGAIFAPETARAPPVA